CEGVDSLVFVLTAERCSCIPVPSVSDLPRSKLPRVRSELDIVGIAFQARGYFRELVEDRLAFPRSRDQASVPEIGNVQHEKTQSGTPAFYSLLVTRTELYLDNRYSDKSDTSRS